MKIALRPYQIECLEAIASSRAAGISRQVVHLPTASGKTVIFSSLISEATKLDPSTRALVLAFSTDLLGQARDKLKMIDPGLDVGLVDMNHKELDLRLSFPAFNRLGSQGIWRGCRRRDSPSASPTNATISQAIPPGSFSIISVLGLDAPQTKNFWSGSPQRPFGAIRRDWARFSIGSSITGRSSK